MARFRPPAPWAAAWWTYHRRPSLPKPEEIFARLDRNDDQQLSLEEFTEGLKRIHSAAAPRWHGGPPAHGSRAPRYNKPSHGQTGRGPGHGRPQRPQDPEE